ncbi:MAG: ABC transporter ATP-binding protein [Candidatus Aminicenantes bacterium]|nr:ABC transporter ATP-binding protein [Candidatus Aminicenantes bacterium]MDH5385338.1 ABC transporter ATP-binding protein [Candidatus Aminicenantes bacterium]MDH5744118.1 ABC transporter ATP-binding protein [Candidatus Aminicenantes bacterium]
MEHILEINKLIKMYPEFILDEIDWNVPKGYVMGLIGPNGAGKTTTIKLIMNLIESDGGHVKVFGLDNIQNEKQIKNKIGYVGEEQYFYDHKSAAWTGEFVSHFYDKWDGEKYQSLLEQFEIPPKKRIRKFSKGMKVKLSLAIALSHNPELIMLDEPTSGLDPIIRREVIDFLKSSTEENDKTVILSSHITDDISRIADYITYMINGRIVMTESKDALLSNWKKIHFTPDSLDKSIIDKLESVESHMFGSSGLTKNFSAIQDVLAPGLASGDIKVESVGLDDILITLVKGD